MKYAILKKMNFLNNTKESIDWTNIVVARGDGIGPEIVDITLEILKKAGAKVKFEMVELGEKLYQKGYETGISDEAWEILRRNKITLKGPITTPQGGGFKSINVTLRKALGLYANVRPCKSYHPFVATNFPTLDVTIIRENEEDLYAGIEYQQSHDAVHCIKLITKTGCENIVRYAFEYAKNNKRKKVTCMTKDNIMKMADGLFHKTFDVIAKEYPEIETEHYIVDIGTARLATKPEIFDVVVTLNLYGDIISDVVAELTGSVGLAGSANIGKKYAMFEAIHGSAPTIVGQGIANPSAIINAAVQMLAYIGQGDIAKKVEDALLYTIESGFHTPDIFKEGVSKKRLSTTEFGQAVIENLGKKPSILVGSEYKNFEFDSKPDDEMMGIAKAKTCDINKSETKELVGVDLFCDFGSNAQEIGEIADKILTGTRFEMKLLSSRGIKVYPSEFAKYCISDSWRMRIITCDESKFLNQDIIKILKIFGDANLDIIKTENLYNFGGKRAYSVSQGE